MPSNRDSATRRFEAIKPLLDLSKRTHEAIQKRAQQLGIGVSTIYRWLKQYDPAIGPQSLCGFSRLKAIASEKVYSENGTGANRERKSRLVQSNYWLSVETADNWIGDKVARFTLLGISDSKRKVAKTMEEGDLLLTYVKGRGFADIRRVSRKGVVPLHGRVPYTDGVFPDAISTEAVCILPFDRHVPVDTMVTQLKFCGTGSHWKHAFRHTLRKLERKDGELIEKSIRAAFLASPQVNSKLKSSSKTNSRQGANPNIHRFATL